MSASDHKSTASAGGNAPRGVELPRQHNLAQAAALAAEAARRQDAEQLEWLGARRGEGCWEIPVLNDVMSVDLTDGSVRTSAGRNVRPQWRILTLHYLCTPERPSPLRPSITFPGLQSGRAYARIYRRRVIERLCAMVGCTAGPLIAAAEKLGAKRLDQGDVAFELQPFPRIAVQLIWYAGEEELPPSAAILLPENIEEFLHIEDVVVLSEQITARLTGGGS